jgi:MFS family permease
MNSQPAGYLELLRINAPFRRLFMARLVSLFGDWFNLLAILALLRELVGVDAQSFGFVLISKMLPSIFIAPVAGVLVDRFERKRLLVVLDLVRALLVLGLLALPALSEAVRGAGIPMVAVLYTFVVLQAACVPVSEPARNAVTPDLVRPQDLVTANALGAAAWSTMFTLGVAAGGLATTYFGWRIALVVDLGTFLLSAALIAGTPIPDHRGETGERPPGGTSFTAGLRFLAARPRLWTLSLAKAGWSLAGGITLVLTVLGERVFTLGGKAILGVSALYMARGVGTGLGPILSRHLCGSDPGRGERIIGYSYLWAAGCYLLLGFTTSLPLALILVVLAHLGGATVWVFSTVRLQALTPTEIRGRVFATEQAVWTVVMAASTYAFSLAIDGAWADLPTITSALGVVLLVPALAWALRVAWVGDPEPSA